MRESSYDLVDLKNSFRSREAVVGRDPFVIVDLESTLSCLITLRKESN
ncbi:hypothetical protein ABID39_001209 [Bartonella japonica]|uniref:Uncharacterized protein n=1 Tax=Bartonella japonica TaxID=357761 RepID=A0ABV2FPU8_9HYPH